jgi:pyridoxine 4-dehydrogenase
MTPSIPKASPPAAAAGSVSIGADLTVHRLGFGAMRLTGAGVWGPPADRQAAVQVLRRALELGVNFIDTADSYGPGVSEEIIAEALHPYPPGLVIATKGGLTRPRAGQWERDAHPAHLRAACEGSLRRLRLNRIDLYQLHAIDPRVPLAESLGELARLQAEGKIRHIGVSNQSLAELKRSQALVSVVSVQNRYNLADRDAEDVLNYCEQQGLAFIPWFPLGAGRDASQAKSAIAWLLARSPVVLPIPGTSSVKHLEENVAAASLHLTAAQLRALG